MNAEVEQIASSDPACQRLRKIPGIGPLVATAIVTAIGNGATFHKDREFASWMGLCRDSARPEGRQDYSASASAATTTCVRSSCTAHDPPFSGSSENELRSAHGSMRLSYGRRSTWSSRRPPMT